MSDALDASRLGDLPNAGYATKRERELTDAIMIFLRKMDRDRPTLLLIVANGPEMFRHIVRESLSGLRVADHLADEVFGYMRRMAGENPLRQLEILAAQQKKTAVERVWGL